MTADERRTERVKVSVVIPNYNGKDYLEDCLNSLRAQDVKQFEIIVVDDASTDGSGTRAAESYPEIIYIQHAENQGFCASVNDGIFHTRADYVLLLNNDTRAEKDFIRRMYHAIRKSRDIFSVSAQMRSLKEPELLDDAGDYYCALGWAFAPAKDKPVKGYRQSREIFAACGGAAIYQKEQLLALGCFDERHFAYLEDMDIGYRAKLKGLRNRYAPEAVVYHAGSASSGSRYNAFKVKLSSRNNVYLIYKNMPCWQILLNFPLLLAGFGIKFLFFLRRGFGRLYLQGLWEGLRMCSQGSAYRGDFSQIPMTRIWRIEAELLLNILRRVL